MIAFIGSVFSPYYAWARRRGGGDPLHHCALNVALYGPRANRWTMTERGRAGVRRSAAHLAIGPSALHWDGTSLAIAIDEVTAPIPSRVRGTVRVHPSALTRQSFALDAAGQHRWSPLAPVARVEVELDAPALRWSGPGYLDSNDGDVPLEASFRAWAWSRAKLRAATAIIYEGDNFLLSLRCTADGTVEPFVPPPPAALPRTFWRMERPIRAEPGAPPRVVRKLEDAPFYSRSVFESSLLGERVLSVHESLSLGRFTSPVVQAMLPFRMPRWG